MKRILSLQNGSRIAVIGGGPAGSFFAHFALKRARKAGLDIALTIFDGKNFLLSGPPGCNLCAGVIAANLRRKLEREGVAFPEERTISRVEGYTFHLDDQTLRLSCQEFGQEFIPTVFRGNGPRYSHFPQIVSFDDFLLTWAADEGAEVVSSPVLDIRRSPADSGSFLLFYGDKASPKVFEADLVVAAMGVNSAMLRKIENLGFGYRPPKTIVAFQGEFRLGRPLVETLFGRTIHVYMPRSNSIRFATVVPKGDYVTLTLVGRKDASPEILKEFLRSGGIPEEMPPLNPSCFCFPRFAISPSKSPFSDRLVIIGDASFSRHFKNGLDSAFMTANLAAEAAFSEGIDSVAFLRAYYRRAKKLIIRDNTFGRLFFRMNDVISSVPLLVQAHASLASRTGGHGAPKKIRAILWNMFTGNVPYSRIFRQTLDLRLEAAIALEVLKLLSKKGPAALKTLAKNLVHRRTHASPHR